MKANSKPEETAEQIKKRVKKAQRNYFQNIKAIENILQKERHYVSKVPENKDVIVLCSGGLDSSVMIQKIIEDWNVRVHPLFFRRGARAEEYEEQAFDFFVDFYRKRFPDNIGELFKLKVEIPPADFKRYFPENLALTQGHPLRNSTMQNLAVMYAVSLQGKGIEARTIFSGSIDDDVTEPELGLLSLRAQTLSTCIQLADWRWNITSPLTDSYLAEKPISKGDLIKYALEKFIPLEKTRTCFSSERTADRTCFACKKRLAAFENIGIKDSLRYQEVKE